MSWCRGLVAGALVIAFAGSAPTSQLFGKKAPKVNPVQRVPELLVTVQQDLEERKRSSAADELRQFNTQEFPDIVPVLVEVMKKEPSSSVRLDVASTLAKARPATKAARDALEFAANNDGHWRVRLNARSSLMFYHVPAETPVKRNDSHAPILGPSTVEPPLFDPAAAQRRAPTPATPVSNPKRITTVPPGSPLIAPGQTAPPPLLELAPSQQQPIVPVGPDEGPILVPQPNR